MFRNLVSEVVRALVAAGASALTFTYGRNKAAADKLVDEVKAAQAHMMKTFAEHYAPAGIRINAVAPGWIETSMNDSLPEDERAHEIAAFVAFVAGSGGSYAYGQNFIVDGGYR